MPLRSFLLFCVLSWGLLGCSSKGGQVNLLEYIPADATGVVAIHLKQLHQKVNQEALKKTATYQEWIKQAGEQQKAVIDLLMSDPEQSGIGMESIYGYTRPRAGQDMFTALLLPVKDKAKWEQFLQGLYDHLKIAFAPKSQDNFQYASLTGDLFFAWDNKMACLAGSSATGVNSLPELGEVFQPKKSTNGQTPNHLGEVLEFKQLNDAGRDMLLWWNPDALIDKKLEDKRASREYIGFLAILGLSPDALKGNHFAMWYDFQQGKIVSGIHYRFSPVLKDYFGGFFKSKSDVDFAPYLPKQGLAMVQCFALEPQKIQQYLRQQHLDMPANLWMGGMGLNTNLLAESIGGEVLVASYMPDPESMDASVNGVVALSLRKPEIAENLLSLFAALSRGKLVKRGNGVYEIIITDPRLEAQLVIYATVHQNMLVLSSRPDICTQAAQGGYPAAQRAAATYMQPVQSSCVGIYLDHQVTAGGSIGAMGFTLAFFGLASDNLAEVLSDYDEMVASTITFGLEDAKAVLQLKTQDRNSLQRVVELSNDMYASWVEVNEQ